MISDHIYIILCTRSYQHLISKLKVSLTNLNELLTPLNVAAEEVRQDIFRLFEDVWEYHPHP